MSSAPLHADMSATTQTHVQTVAETNPLTEFELGVMRGAILCLESLEAPLRDSPATTALASMIDNAMGHRPAENVLDGCTVCGSADGHGACRTWESALVMARNVRRIED